MDQQAAEMERDLEGARIERIGEGIKITFDSGILFDVNKSDLKAEAQENLANATLVAPFAGTVTAVHVTEGEAAAEGETAGTPQVAGPGVPLSQHIGPQPNLAAAARKVR